MTIKRIFTPLEVRAAPEVDGLKNVIQIVTWEMRFECVETGRDSLAQGETILSLPNPEHYIPADSVDWSVLEAWVISAEGGDAFLQDLEAFHREELERQKQYAAADIFDGFKNADQSSAWVKEQLCAQIDLERNKAIARGVLFKGQRYQSDRVSIQRVLNAVQLMSEENTSKPKDWITADNTIQSLSLSDLKSLAHALVTHEEQCVMLARDYKNRVQSIKSLSRSNSLLSEAVSAFHSID